MISFDYFDKVAVVNLLLYLIYKLNKACIFRRKHYVGSMLYYMRFQWSTKQFGTCLH